MREHAIPQDVVGYKFHIVGSMTLKQFLEVGTGCVIGVLIYNTNLFFPIKWIGIGTVVGIGVLAAFVPFEERPLSHWLVTFFSVLYKPTKFFWKRQPKIPDAFLYKPMEDTAFQQVIDLSPARRERIKDYLTSLSSTQRNEEDILEENRLAEIFSHFESIETKGGMGVSQTTRPNLKITTHSLTRVELAPLSEQVDDESAFEENPFYYTPSSSEIAFSKQGLETTEVGKDIVIPEITPVEVDTLSQGITEEIASSAQESVIFSELTMNQPVEPALQATTNQQLPFPKPPTEPNKLVGMVLTPQNEGIQEAIVQILDERGGVARAVKTNPLGQFFITTPLPNGSYTISTEKDSLDFLPLSITLTNQRVDPIEIRSVV